MSKPPLTPNAWLRFDVIRHHLRRRPPPESILEIGMGQGAVGTRLAALGRYTGVEPDDRSRAVASQRLPASATVLASTDQLDEDERFDLMCAFEVLEHIEDDRAALEQWSGSCRPGGWLLMSVPAKQHRYGPMDERVGHYRRYDREVLIDLVQSLGFTDIVADHYGFPLGYVLEGGRDVIARRRPGGGEMEERSASSGRLFQPDTVVGVASMVGTAPFRLAQRPFRRSRMGTGLVLSARRATGS
jgi:SAM-dependent methyltransferase